MPTRNMCMRILVITSFPPLKAGDAEHAFHLCRHLADYGFDVHVATMKASIVPNRARMTVYPIMRDWSWSDLPRLAILMRRCSPDAVLLVYFNGFYKHHPMITFTPTVAKVLLPGVPFVTLFEDGYGSRPWPTSLFARAIRKGIFQLTGRVNMDHGFGTLLRESDRIIVVSVRTRDMLAQRFSGVNEKSVLIPPPPPMFVCPEDSDAARQYRSEILGSNVNDYLLVYFGYVYPSKGLETLLKAFAIVRVKRINIRLVIVGEALQFPHRPFYVQDMLELVKELGIEDSVMWTGGYSWDSDKASGYLRASDLCVLPFDSGVCLHNSSFACAAAHGLPIITTRGEMLEPPFVDQKNVFLCPPKNPEAMAAAIETVMENPALQRRLRAEALELAREWFSWDRAIERTIATFSLSREAT